MCGKERVTKLGSISSVSHNNFINKHLWLCFWEGKISNLGLHIFSKPSRKHKEEQRAKTQSNTQISASTSCHCLQMWKSITTLGYISSVIHPRRKNSKRQPKASHDQCPLAIVCRNDTACNISYIFSYH